MKKMISFFKPLKNFWEKRLINHLTKKGNVRKLFEYHYKKNRKKNPDLVNPKDLSEIWISKYLSGYFDDYAYLADKFAVRDYIEKKIGSKYLTKLWGVWENANDINFSSLPEKFALKANFGSQMNFICTEKKSIDIESVRNLLNRWMQVERYSFTEKHYDKIPHKIICEEFLQDEHGGFPVDYKFMCFCGIPYCILACGNREKGNPTYTPYTLDWKPIMNYRIDGRYEDLPKPPNLEEMILCAKVLSKDFDLIRVDLYDTGKKVIFGEMTMTPAACLFSGWTQTALDEMGEFYRLQKSQYE